MYRVIAVLCLLFASPWLAKAQPKSYQFGECLGHETICDDEFNEVIILSVDDDGAIATDLQSKSATHTSSMMDKTFPMLVSW